MHPAKINFRKMHPKNLQCYLGCSSDEDQRHIFEKCKVLQSDNNRNLYDYIFGESHKQKEAISAFILLEERRRDLIQSTVTQGL